MLIKKIKTKSEYNKRIKISIWFFLLLSIFMFKGCLSIQTNVDGLKPYAKPMECKKYEIIGKASGMSSSFNLLWFILVTPDIDYGEAIDNTINSAAGDNLIDVRVWRERQVWIVGSVNILHVQGKVIRYSE